MQIGNQFSLVGKIRIHETCAPLMAFGTVTRIPKSGMAEPCHSSILSALLFILTVHYAYHSA